MAKSKIGIIGNGKVGGALTVYAAADDRMARQQALEMAADIGFNAVDAGPLRNARLLESLGYLNFQVDHVRGLGPSMELR